MNTATAATEIATRFAAKVNAFYQAKDGAYTMGQAALIVYSSWPAEQQPMVFKAIAEIALAAL